MAVLEEIVGKTRALVAARKRRRSQAEIEQSIVGETRGFARALAAGPTAFIFECKQASPSQGVIREPYDPAAIARDYEDVATCISVLTAEPSFRGSLSHLQAVHDAVGTPLLCKDFMVDPYQIYEARAHGADAILLICAALSDQELRRFAALATELGMDALVEVHNAQELDRALASDAKLVGINNRNLKTMEISLEVTEELAGRIPPEVTLVAESGISSRADVRRLRPLVDAFLIGTHLMRRDDIAQAARELAYGRVKICGLTRPQDAMAAWRAGACFGGMIFAGESPRALDEQQAMALSKSAPLSWVGVFVNEEHSRVVRLAEALSLSAVQLHGDESAPYVSALRRALPTGCAIWRAHSIREGAACPKTADTAADRLLLDAHHPRLRGGSGQTFDWERVKAHPERADLVLAGGLNPSNVKAAEALDVWALDLSSGVETAPGIKDHEALASLFATLRGESIREGGVNP